ncbi:nicotinate-nucleotide--dimethylbenzimidazole phosphoribosyltransferase [Silanimonas sp.]|jgi:nicotinate-nucleotide--dimethylbenzimidazole phosphoribosyltransferase|uniref:nicotinate-nucleotide--dimethylbenzimidazole phosphoribosyltransferase n=1 Tax=Silanimonas sp. TaxID=1929290 RepID=UPI0037CC2B21
MPAEAPPSSAAPAASFTPPTLPRIEVDGDLARRVRHALDNKTKPPGSLGRLEDLALQLALVQDCVDPRVAQAEVRVFAGDHGVVAEGVSPYPQAVTAQMVANFLAGGAAISVLARQFDARLAVVDAGVASVLADHPMLLSRRIANGTANFANGPAMGAPQAVAALEAGVAIGRGLAAQSVLVLGEMGIGNTTSAAAIMAALTGESPSDCVGRGTGVDDAGLTRKAKVVARALKANNLAAHTERPIVGTSDGALRVLAAVGGFEIAMMAGALLGAGSVRALVVVDGFIATAAAALALAIDPAIKPFLVFAHVSAEAPHARWLAQLDAEPLLALGLRLGEGSGAILALPLLRAACALLAEMATFDSAGVSDRA